MGTLAVIRKDEPITLAEYARDRKLLQQRGWKWAKKITRRGKKFVWMLKAMKTAKTKTLGAKYKFGVQLPWTGDVKHALKLDKQNGNQLWFNAQKTEATSLLDLDTFWEMPPDFNLTGYQYVLHGMSSLIVDTEQG